MNSTEKFCAVLSALSEQYAAYSLNVRGVCDATLRLQWRYIHRFLLHLGPAESEAELFARIGPVTLARFRETYSKEERPWCAMSFALRSFLSFAFEEELLVCDYSVLVPTVLKRTLSGLPRAMPEDAIRILDASIDRTTPLGLRDAAVIGLFIVYGVRPIQVRQLELGDIDWVNDRIHFPAAKRGRPIAQYLTPDMGNRLSSYILHGRPTSRWRRIFLTTDGEPLNHPGNLVSKYIQKAGITLPEGVSHGAYGLRHAFAKRLVGNVPFQTLVDSMGHRSSSSTLVYAKIDVPALQQAALPWPEVLS